MESQRPEVFSTYYVSHGSHMQPVQQTPAARFLRGLGGTIKGKPRAILAVSAHWSTSELIVTSRGGDPIFFDFPSGPAVPNQHQYRAPGTPDLAKRVQALLQEAGYRCIEDPNRGLDHGAWMPLLLMYPEADIPVIELSLQRQKDGGHHYNVGRALAPLTKEGILILGSGTAIHNMDYIGRCRATPKWAKAFDDWLNDALEQSRFNEVIHYLEKGPHAQTAHPKEEHFVPLLIALGAAGEAPMAKRIHQSWEEYAFSMAAFEFKPVVRA